MKAIQLEHHQSNCTDLAAGLTRQLVANVGRNINYLYTPREPVISPLKPINRLLKADC